MTTGFGGNGWERLWLKREPSKNSRGHFEFAGDCGLHRVVVEIDPTITWGLSDIEAEQRLLAMHRQIQDAARRKYRDYEAYEYFPAPDRRVLGIALTDQDVVIQQA